MFQEMQVAGGGGASIISLAEMPSIVTDTEVIAANTQPSFTTGSMANRVIMTTYTNNAPYTAINFNPTTGDVSDNKCWYRQTKDGSWTESSAAYFTRTSTTVTFSVPLSAGNALGISLIATLE